MNHDKHGRFVKGNKINLGVVKSKKTKQLMSESHIGIPVWNKGKKQTKKHSDNISKSLMGNKNPMYGKRPWNYGLTKKSDKRVLNNGKKISKAKK